MLAVQYIDRYKNRSWRRAQKPPLLSTRIKKTVLQNKLVTNRSVFCCSSFVTYTAATWDGICRPCCVLDDVEVISSSLTGFTPSLKQTLWLSFKTLADKRVSESHIMRAEASDVATPDDHLMWPLPMIRPRNRCMQEYFHFPAGPYVDDESNLAANLVIFQTG